MTPGVLPILFATLLLITASSASPGDPAATNSRGSGTSTRELITFPSKDQIPVTADLYLAHQDLQTPFIVLFHQAKWSRGEYDEVAPRLNDLGFNCMSVDLRYGDAIFGVDNETAKAAARAKRPTGLIDGIPDIIGALEHARDHYAKGTLLAFGSSYSGSLVLKICGVDGNLMDGVIAFSPGEYFVEYGKSDSWITESAGQIEHPVFITSAKVESNNWKPIFDAIPSTRKVGFIPETDGHHGSRSLWAEFEDSDSYWEALLGFLKEHARE